MNLKRYLGAAFALFVFIFFYEWLVHGYLLLGMYHKTSTVWRDFAEMAAHMPLAMCFQLALAAWTAFVFTQIFKEGGVKIGLFFGGLFWGIRGHSPPLPGTSGRLSPRNWDGAGSRVALARV